MKKIAIAAVTGVFALAACGGAAAPSAATQAVKTNAPSAAATQSSAATSAATQAASAAPTTGGSSGDTAPRKIAVTATNSLYSITTLEVKANEKIEFVLTNTGDEKHNMVGIGSDISLVSPDFDAGQTLSWIWTAPAKAGTFKLQCSYHKDIPPVVVTVK